MKNKEKKQLPCNCLNLRRASTAITKLYDERLSSSGITISQFSILTQIKNYGPISVSDLAFNIRLDRTTLVRNLKPLESTELIKDISEGKSRNRQLQLTEKGLECCAKAERLWIGTQKYMEEKLGKENIEALTELLSQVEQI